MFPGTNSNPAKGKMFAIGDLQWRAKTRYYYASGGAGGDS